MASSRIQNRRCTWRKRLAQLCAKSTYKGVVIDDVDKAKIKKLPTNILNQLSNTDFGMECQRKIYRRSRHF